MTPPTTLCLSLKTNMVRTVLIHVMCVSYGVWWVFFVLFSKFPIVLSFKFSTIYITELWFEVVGQRQHSRLLIWKILVPRGEDGTHSLLQLRASNWVQCKALRVVTSQCIHHYKRSVWFGQISTLMDFLGTRPISLRLWWSPDFCGFNLWTWGAVMKFTVCLWSSSLRPAGLNSRSVRFGQRWGPCPV